MGKMPGRPPGESGGGEGAPQRGGLPVGERRVSTTQAEGRPTRRCQGMPRRRRLQAMSQFGFAEKPQRAKNGRTNGARIFRVPQGGRSCGWPGNEPAGGDCRLCHSPDLRRAEKPQRAKKRANEWCEVSFGCRKAGGAAVGRGMSPPAGEKRRCHVHLPAGAPA